MPQSRSSISASQLPINHSGVKSYFHRLLNNISKRAKHSFYSFSGYKPNKISKEFSAGFMAVRPSRTICGSISHIFCNLNSFPGRHTRSDSFAFERENPLFIHSIERILRPRWKKSSAVELAPSKRKQFNFYLPSSLGMGCEKRGLHSCSSHRHFN